MSPSHSLLFLSPRFLPAKFKLTAPQPPSLKSEQHNLTIPFKSPQFTKTIPLEHSSSQHGYVTDTNRDRLLYVIRDTTLITLACALSNTRYARTETIFCVEGRLPGRCSTVVIMLPAADVVNRRVFFFLFVCSFVVSPILFTKLEYALEKLTCHRYYQNTLTCFAIILSLNSCQEIKFHSENKRETASKGMKHVLLGEYEIR